MSGVRAGTITAVVGAVVLAVGFALPLVVGAPLVVALVGVLVGGSLLSGGLRVAVRHSHLGR